MSLNHQTIPVTDAGVDVDLVISVQGYTLSTRGADVFVKLAAAGNTVVTSSAAPTAHNQRIDARKPTYMTTFGRILLGARCATGTTATLYLDVGHPGGD